MNFFADNNNNNNNTKKRFSQKTVLKILIASFSNLFINYLSKKKHVTSSKNIFLTIKSLFAVCYISFSRRRFNIQNVWKIIQNSSKLLSVIFFYIFYQTYFFISTLNTFFLWTYVQSSFTIISDVNSLNVIQPNNIIIIHQKKKSFTSLTRLLLSFTSHK